MFNLSILNSVDAIHVLDAHHTSLSSLDILLASPRDIHEIRTVERACKDEPSWWSGQQESLVRRRPLLPPRPLQQIRALW
jgi:hypothetical protein